MKHHLLLVEDNPTQQRYTQDFLSHHGFHVHAVNTGKSMWVYLEENQVDLVLLDLNLPDADGIDLLQQLRQQDHDFYVIVVSARKEDSERVIGLNVGADDYIVKPVNFWELEARINAVLRRTTHEKLKYKVYQFDNFTFYPIQHLLKYGEEKIPLTTHESDLLRILIEHQGKVLSREKLVKSLNTQTTDLHTSNILISRLRRKMEVDPTQPKMITTIYNQGYCFCPLVEVK